MTQPLKPEDSFEARDVQKWPCDNLWQRFVQWLRRPHPTACTVVGIPGLTADDSDAKFMRPTRDFEPGFAVQDMFDLSLTWDDLRFLRSAHILPLEDTRHPVPSSTGQESLSHHCDS